MGKNIVSPTTYAALTKTTKLVFAYQLLLLFCCLVDVNFHKTDSNTRAKDLIAYFLSIAIAYKMMVMRRS